MNLALELINENKRTQSSFLDLGKCGLEYSWPEEILGFDWLEGINFSMGYYDDYENDHHFSSNKGSNNKFTGNEGFERLQQLPRLRSLDFGFTGLSNISFLRSLPRLKILMLGSNPITDIGPISSLKHLTYLNLAGAQFKDVSPLIHLTELRHFHLTGSPHTGLLPITNLSFLRSLKKLRSLVITHSHLTDISALQELTRMVSLSLFANKINSIHGIQDLSYLKEADFSNNNIKDLSPLYSPNTYLRSLEKLKLDANEIECLDLRVLNNMLNLKDISIYNNPVKNIPHDTLHYGTIGEIRAYLQRKE